MTGLLLIGWSKIEIYCYRASIITLMRNSLTSWKCKEHLNGLHEHVPIGASKSSTADCW